MNEMYLWHMQHYPAMQPQDIVKLFFQATLGCGHLLGDESVVAQRITAEEKTLVPSFAEPLTEPLGPDYVRLNLRRSMAEGIPAAWIARLMKQSIPDELPGRESVVQEIEALHDDALLLVARRLLEEPQWIPSHTEAYHTAYAPAYRVISRVCAQCLPVLTCAAKMLQKERLLICIDGPCGSGKSTMAGILRNTLDAAVVPMDDFFLPHPRKTADRLSQPGGNADWERLSAEFLQPWLTDGQASYRPYDCHSNTLAPAVSVPQKQFTIIEGSYSLLPDIGKYADIRVFLQISPEEQHRRILNRNGENLLKIFVDRWIPLEQAYFSAFSLPDASCLVISAQEQK